jgi:hypothetical protein
MNNWFVAVLTANYRRNQRFTCRADAENYARSMRRILGKNFRVILFWSENGRP